jgi:hypothetical protein
MNKEDLKIVEAKLAEQGIKFYSTYAANGCIGVSYGRVSAYYFVRDGKVVDIIID